MFPPSTLRPEWDLKYIIIAAREESSPLVSSEAKCFVIALSLGTSTVNNPSNLLISSDKSLGIFAIKPKCDVGVKWVFKTIEIAATNRNHQGG
jgi:hypothetical protein